MAKKGLVWIRRDLRLHDHAALAQCLKENDTTYIAFIFDTNILTPLRKKSTADSRLHFIAQSLLEIATTLQKQNAGLILRHADPITAIPNLTKTLNIDTVYFNRDYTPYTLARDAEVTATITKLGKQVKTVKDHCIVEPAELLNKQQLPYKVFTPYSKAWLARLTQTEDHLKRHPVTIKNIKNNYTSTYTTVEEILKVAEFEPCPPHVEGGSKAGLNRLREFTQKQPLYHQTRDIPSTDGTSKLSVYIRHGCISIRDMVTLANSEPSEGASTWLNELIWREFYHMITYHYPHSIKESFNPKYKHLKYPGSKTHYEAWKQGQTGVPIVDAAMRCLNQTGWMHNRLRMITASYLCKILLVDWKKGERYFAWKLLDYDVTANNGGWQWCSSTGCDAAPYFRIFNPYTQSKKFDPNGEFIKQYCPELSLLSTKDIHNPNEAKTLPIGFELGKTYPKPVVDYKQQRLKCLELYKSIANP